jgi:hypothetical protein
MATKKNNNDDNSSGGADHDKGDAGLPSFDSIDALTASLKALKGDPLEADGGGIVVYRGRPAARVMLIGQGQQGVMISFTSLC